MSTVKTRARHLHYEQFQQICLCLLTLIQDVTSDKDKRLCPFVTSGLHVANTKTVI